MGTPVQVLDLQKLEKMVHFHLAVKLNERPLRSKFMWLACDLVKGKQLKLLLITLVS